MGCIQLHIPDVVGVSVAPKAETMTSMPAAWYVLRTEDCSSAVSSVNPKAWSAAPEINQNDNALNYNH